MIPTPVEVADSLSAYNAQTDKWHSAVWHFFYQLESSKYAPINFSATGGVNVVSGTAGKKILIYSLFFTVGGATEVTLKDGNNNISGPMDFGDTSEPRGIVVPLTILPIELGSGNSFVISISSSVQVSGMVIYRLV